MGDFVAAMERWEKSAAEERSAAPPYVFDGGVGGKVRDFDSHFMTPPQFEGYNTILQQFMLGPRGSGAPPHFHNSAWNGLVYGRKRWYLFPPSEAFFSAPGVTAGQWAARERRYIRLQAVHS